MITQIHPLARVILVVGVLSAFMAGCVGYSTYPPADGQVAGTDPNQPAAEEAMAAALAWVVDRFPPPSEPYAINPPVGLRADTYRRVVVRVGENALPVMTVPETKPVYHVRKVWVRGPDAQIEIVRPVVELSDPEGGYLEQGVTVWLKGGFRPWRVDRHRVWRLGTLDAPELYTIRDAEEQDALAK